MDVNYLLEGEGPYVGFMFIVDTPEGLLLAEDPENPGYPWYDQTVTAISRLSITTASNGGFAATPKTATSTINGNSGVLMRIKVSADAALEVGSTHTITLKEISFNVRDENYNVTKRAVEDVTFTVTIGEPADTRTVLDENSTAVSASATGVDVRVKRTIKANEWSTICLPFAMTEAQVKTTFGDDVELADFTGADSDIDDADNVVGITVNFDDVKAIEANHPYIIKVSQPMEEFTLDGVDIVADEDEAYIEFDNGKTGSRRVVYSGFYGTYHAGTVLDEFTVFLSDNKFWYSTGLTKMKAFRAYFDFLDVLTEVEDAASSRIRMSFSDQTVTGIREIGNRESENSEYFDLQGRRVVKPGKGLYIQNGKKLMK